MSQALELTSETGESRYFSPPEPFPLECGESLPNMILAYETWGELRSERDNAVFVCHALTGSGHAASHGPGDSAGWWEALIGPGKALDPSQQFIVCANVLGSCYGSSGPASPDSVTGRRHEKSFPLVTTRDIVRAFKLLLDSLGVRRLGPRYRRLPRRNARVAVARGVPGFRGGGPSHRRNAAGLPMGHRPEQRRAPGHPQRPGLARAALRGPRPGERVRPRAHDRHDLLQERAPVRSTLRARTAGSASPGVR